MNDIQKKISDYLKGKTEPTEHDLLCFVGMIETGEATADDFRAIGGDNLADVVAKYAEMGYVK